MDRTIWQNTAALLTIQAASWLFPLITFPYLVRCLGAAQFGSMMFAQAVVTYVLLVSEYGFNWSATHIASVRRNEPAVLSRHFANVTAAKCLLAMGGTLILAILCEAIPHLKQNRTLILANLPAVAGAILIPQWLYQGMENVRPIAISMVLGRMAIVPMIFLFVHHPGDTATASLISSSGGLLSGLIVQAHLRHWGIVRYRLPDLAGLRAALISGWHVFLSTASISLYTTANNVVLGLVSGPAAVGQFAAADKFRLVAQNLLEPLSSATYPRVGPLVQKKDPEGFALVRRLFVLQIPASALLGIALCIFAPQLVSLVLGPGYAEAAPILRMLAFIPLLVRVSGIFGVQMMIPMGMTRTFSRILLAAGLSNIMLMLPLAARYRGMGAAMAVFVTELIITLAMGIALSRTGALQDIFRHCPERVR